MGREGLSGHISRLICFRTSGGDLPRAWVDRGPNSLPGSTCPCILTTALGQKLCFPCSSLPPVPFGEAFPTGNHDAPPRSQQG